MFLVHHFLEKQAKTRPEALAGLHGERSANYAAIDLLANRFAHALRELGLVKADRVVLMYENSIEYIAAYYGILKAGCISVALYPNSTMKTLRFVIADCGVKALLCSRKNVRQLAESGGLPEGLRGCVTMDGRDDAAGAIPLEILSFDDLGSMPSARPDTKLIDTDRASIIYTSGSTGEPRGVVLRHLNIVANTRSIVDYLNLTEQDRIIVVLPFPYVYGKSLLNTHFFVGGSVVIDNRFVFPNVVLKTMQETQATGFSGVPSTFAILLHRSTVKTMRFPHLRYLTQAGGAMAPSLTKEVMDVFPGKELYVMYGATEASARLSYLPPTRLADKLGSIGRAIPNVELRVLKDDGEEADVGETGELVARGSNIMEGYWNRPGETADFLTEAGLHTGDLARRDEDGFLYIVGRRRDMIKSGANRVSAMEVEDTLMEHPGILEAAVIGVPDQILGEAIHAFVVSRNGAVLEPSPVIDFCRKRLLEFKVPRRLVVVEALPKNASGKIMKEELREHSA